MAEVRMGIVAMLQVSGDLIEYKDALEFNVPLVVNAILQTHRVMRNFIKVGIKKHADVSAQYIMFLVTNSRIEVVDSLQKEFTALKSDVADSASKVKAAHSAATTASNKISNVEKDIKDLQKAVNKKADKK